MPNRETIGIEPTSYLGGCKLPQVVIALELEGLQPEVHEASPVDWIDWDNDKLCHMLAFDCGEDESPAWIIDRVLAIHYPKPGHAHGAWEYGTNGGMW